MLLLQTIQSPDEEGRDGNPRYTHQIRRIVTTVGPDLESALEVQRDEVKPRIKAIIAIYGTLSHQ
jgi:hypothetical protein